MGTTNEVIMKLINLAVSTVYQGKHYQGVTIYPGVSMSFEPMPCVADKTRIVFTGSSVKPNIFVDAISSIEESEIHPDTYVFLQIPNDE
jgi:hypothetical protein